MSFIVNKDIVILAETKSKADSFVPGFKIIHSKKTKHRCGGVIVLIKNYLYSQVTHIDISVEDQIWFWLRDIPDIMIGGIYIPPSDSLYYFDESISYIQSKCETENCDFIFGEI